MVVIAGAQKMSKEALQKCFVAEREFIGNLFKIIAMPTHDQEEEDDYVYMGKEKPSREEARKIQRAKSFQELNERLNKLKGSKDFSIKNKLMKKSLTKRIKKKNRKEERNSRKKMVKLKKTLQNEEAKVKVDSETDQKVVETKKPIAKLPPKPVFNSQGKMVFSKFDFSESGIPGDKKKGERDPKKILDNLKKQKETIKELKESGEKDKAAHMMEKIAWKNALAKAEGQKIKDDPMLLKKTVMKTEQRKKQSAKKWEQRLQGVQKAKEDRQKKRETNLSKRKQDKKKKIIKKAVKKGRMIS